MPFRCSVCGELHDELPDIGANCPDPWFGIPEDERDRRVRLTGDTCVIDEDCFIRGVLDIPIHDQPEPFGFGVWVSQKRENFQTYLDNFDTPDIGPFFGWLCTRIAYYEADTYGLKTRAHFRGNGLRPRIEVEPTDHPLAVDQREGITLARAWEIVHFYEAGGRRPEKAPAEAIPAPKGYRFADPPNQVTVTLRQVLHGGRPVLLAVHDLDGTWQFLTGGPVEVADMMLVGLGEMAKHDASLNELADLPVGWEASRKRVGGRWKREPHPEHPEDEDAEG